MKSNSAQSDTFITASHEDISQRARELWAGYGHPEGRDEQIWLEAERQLLGVDPLVEGQGDTSVSAKQFDEATSQGKPRTRLPAKSSSGKAAARSKR
ncbi:MAG: DUF2934 domain-containing protein [Rariglobus sp.]